MILLVYVWLATLGAILVVALNIFLGEPREAASERRANLAIGAGTAVACACVTSAVIFTALRVAAG